MEGLEQNILMLARQSFLDLSGTANIGLLDAVVSFLELNSDVGRCAHKLLEELQSKLKNDITKRSWLMYEMILSLGNVQTKSVFLKGLKEKIKCQRHMLTNVMKDRLIVYINNLIMLLSSDEVDDVYSDVIRDLNQILREILKLEWPARWEEFFFELSILVMASCSERYIATSLDVIGEILPPVMKVKADMDKEFMKRHCWIIQTLCRFLLGRNLDKDIRCYSLQMLFAVLSAVPRFTCDLGFLDLLLSCFRMPSNMTERILALQCLTQAVQVFEFVGGRQSLVLLHEEVLKYMQGNWETLSDKPEMLQYFANFLTSYYKNHMMLIEDLTVVNRPLLSYGLDFLIDMLDMGDEEHRMLCLEFWCFFVLGLSNLRTSGDSMLPGQGGKPESLPYADWLKILFSCRNCIGPSLSKLRNFIIEHMAKPEEVMVIKDETGNINRETVDSGVEYKIMRDIISSLTRLGACDTEDKIIKALERCEANRTQSNVSKVFWAIGSIAGAMPEYREDIFLSKVFRYLPKIEREDDDSVVNASNIMYIFGQYPRFICDSVDSKQYVQMLFYFMHFKHQAIQDMASRTFWKIIQKCKSKFVIVQAGKRESLVAELLADLPSTIQGLEPQQIQNLRQCFDIIIQAEPNDQEKGKFLDKLKTV